MPDQLSELQSAIKNQGDRLFPNRTDTHMFLKMYEEIGEVIKAGDDTTQVGLEVADIMIMLLDYAARKGVQDLSSYIDYKMHRNDEANWQEINGVYKRIK